MKLFHVLINSLDHRSKKYINLMNIGKFHWKKRNHTHI